MRLVAVVNEKARRGGVLVARALSRALPRAEVVLTRSLAELDEVAKALVESPPDLVIGAGGDGTALGLINALRRARPAPVSGAARAPLATLALVRLGTGNGWANTAGAPSVRRSLELLADTWGAPLPRRRFDLLEVEGIAGHFAGTGWDAELIDDFHAQKTGPGLLPPPMRYGVAGYLNGLFTRAVPRNLTLPRVEVEVENAGRNALGVDARGLPFEIPCTEAGADASLLYRGPVSVCGVGTTSQWGFGFKAFPFAGLVRGRFNLRMYAASTLEAVSRIPVLWAGAHPLSKMHTWLLDRVTVRFSRAVPLQIGGDLVGHRDRVTYAMSEDHVEVLDWRALVAAHAPRERGVRGALLGALRPATVFLG